MKQLAPDEIECLLGVRPSNLHPIEVLGYEYGTKGMRRYRAERPDVLPQVIAHIHQQLERDGIFPHINPTNPGLHAFIAFDGDAFCFSRMEEAGVSQYKRFKTTALTATEAIGRYISQSPNLEYLSGDGRKLPSHLPGCL